MLIKVCGMRDSANIHEIAGLKPDLLGFIFYPQSKRYVGKEFPQEIIDSVMPGIKKVGVFVNEELDSLILIQQKYNFDFVQLHGNESPLYCQAVREKGIKVWKAFGIHENFDWSALNPYLEVCDYFLFDTSSKGYGGSGVKFDWHMLGKYKLTHPYFLSGGIGPEDASDIANLKFPLMAGIDINSRFEIEPGYKDAGKVKVFFERIKGK
jgi:phosphoribosylanthranilate isomerase